MMKIESFAGRIRREQDRVPALEKIAQDGPALRARKSAVQHGAGTRDRPGQVQQRIAILGEDDDRLGDPAEKPDERRNLRFVSRRLMRGSRQLAEHRVFARGIVERQARQLRRSVGIGGVTVGIRHGERELMGLPRIRRQRVEPPCDSALERSGARERPLVQDREREPRRRAVAGVRDAHRPAEAGDERVHPAFGGARHHMQLAHGARRQAAPGPGSAGRRAADRRDRPARTASRTRARRRCAASRSARACTAREASEAMALHRSRSRDRVRLVDDQQIPPARALDGKTSTRFQ